MLFYVDIYSQSFVAPIHAILPWTLEHGGIAVLSPWTPEHRGIAVLGATGDAVIWPAPRGPHRSGYIVVCPD